MRTRLIAEVGSNHGGKLDYIKEIIEGVSEAGWSAVKFQLFPNTEQFTKSGNVFLSKDLYLQARDYAEECGIDCSASVFGQEEFDFLLSLNPPWIKFAYSQKNRADWIRKCLDMNTEAIVSCDVMTDHDLPPRTTRLFCIPHYPVYSEISFDELFPRFDGFSDHSLGIRQTLRAVEEGAMIIEKHVKIIKKDVRCPDSFFSITLAEAAQLTARISTAEYVRDE